MILRRSLFFSNVTVLSAAGILGDGLRVMGSRVAAIGGSPHRDDIVVDGGGGVLVPGLVNAHDHLELNNFTRLKFRPRYTHVLQWIEDIEARLESDPSLVQPRRQPLPDRLFIGVLKNLLSGVTTVCHHNPLYRPLRSSPFIRVVKHYGFAHSLFRGEGVEASFRKNRPGWPWIIHLAEGVDSIAAGEFERLRVLELIQPNTVLVHGVGLTPPQRRQLAAVAAGLVWCPGSNLFMFGQTASVAGLAAAGKLALGSDSRLSGERDLLAELQVAAGTGQLSSRQLFEAVTVAPARMLGLDQSGMLTVGGAADLLLLPPAGPEPWAAILHLSRSQLELVMLAGRPLVGSPATEVVFEAARDRAVPFSLDGRPRLMARRLAAKIKKNAIPEPGLVL